VAFVQSLKKYIAFIFAISLLASCNRVKLSSQNPQIELGPIFNPTAIGDCPTSPNTGGSPYPKLQKPTFNDSGYFSKEFRQLFFLQALKASSFDVVNWLYEQGVQIRKIETNSKSKCRYFGFLNKANQEYLTIWENHGGQSQSNGEQTLQGLFRTFLHRPSNGGPVQMQNPVILLRDDTDRWTLLHEKTHFLFAQGRVQDPNMFFIETLREDNRTLYRKLRHQEFTYIQEKNSALAKQILKTFSDYLSVNQELFSRGPLEEFTIESLISTQVIQNNSQGLNQIKGLRTALAFMKANTEPVLLSYETLIQKLRNYQGDLFKDESTSTLGQVQDLEISLQTKIDFIQKKILYLQTHLEEIGERNLAEPHHLLDHPHYNFELLKEQLRLIESLNLSHTRNTHNSFNF